jgi:class 3 adenylate cyclase
MNTQYSNYSSFGYSPVNYTNVRQALVHAVNYSEISNELFTATNPQDNSTVKLGELFLPPVPPGLGELDNPQGIPLYSFNIPLAQQLIARAGSEDGFYIILPNGTSLGDTNGQLFNSIDYGWWGLTGVSQTLLQIANKGFNQIGITVYPKFLNFTLDPQLLNTPNTTPPLTSSGTCASWPDPIYQDFYYLGTPSLSGFMSGWVDNSTLARLLSVIPFEPYVGLQLEQTEEAYRIYTQLSSMLQLPSSVNYFFLQPYLQNVTYSPFQYGFYYDMMSYGYSSSTTAVSTKPAGTSNNPFSFMSSTTIGLFAVVLAAAVLLGYLALSRRSATAQVTRRLAAIMFTDLVGYTALGQRNESLSLEVVEEQRKLIRPILERHNGREVKTMGDAFLVEFASALEAVRCAFDIQESIRAFNTTVSQEKKIHLRIGIHLGDVVESGGDISGDAVNVASRIEPLAEDAGVCLTRQVYDQVANKFEHPLQSLGMKELKNVVAPQEIFKIVMPWESGSPAESK